MNEKFEKIAMKYFSNEIIMMSKKFHDRLISALEEAYNLDGK